MQRLIKYMSQVNDFRTGFNKKHKLIDILAIAVLAVLSGMKTWNEIELYGRLRIDFLKRFLELPAGIPSHDTFNRVFSMLDPAQLENALQGWVKELVATLPADVVAIDGKAIRGSAPPDSHAYSHIVTAYATNCGLSLAQLKVDEKSNEITAIPKLLDMLDLEGSIVTIDAMGCQYDIAAKILEKKADYIFSLKGNQSSLRGDALSLTMHGQPDDVFEQADAGHGRVETRRTSVFRDMCYIQRFWPGLAAVVRIETTRYDKTNNRPLSTESRLYISSLRDVCAEKFASWVRSHWGIENALHWVLDVVFREDAGQKRAGNSAENFSKLVRFARNILKRYKQTIGTRDSYNLMMTRAALQQDFSVQVLRHVFS